VIDVRDAKAMLARLSDVQRGFEKGGPVPHTARDLFSDLIDALADSGPFELCVRSSEWLASITSAERGLAAADDPSSTKAVRRAKRSIRDLRRFFGDKRWTWRDWLALPFLLLFGALMAIWLVPLLALCLLIAKACKRYHPDVRKTVTRLDLPDRALFADPVKGTSFTASSPARVRIGAYIHPVLVATDRRMLLAEPSSELPAPSDRQRFSIAWEIPYPRIRSCSIGDFNGGENATVIIEVRERTIAYKMPSDDSKALMAILKRRAPEAFDESRLPRPSPDAVPA
jgi:hypothetical protein